MPCGYAVDLLRSCYHDRMRGLGPNGESVRVRWYFTDDPFLPFPTVFVSRQWYDEHPPWPVTKPGPVRHRGEYTLGDAPPGDCCDTPFGDRNAFLGGGGPARLSCPWFSPIVQLQIVLIMRSTVKSPTYYAGRLKITLSMRSTVKSPRRYVGQLKITLSMRSTVVSPRFYVGHLRVNLSMRSTVRSVMPYHGSVRLDLSMRTTPRPGPWYLGRVPLALSMRSTPAVGPLYPGRLPLALSMRSASSPNDTLVYGSCTGGIWRRWTLAISGVTGTGGFSFNQTFAMDYNVTQGYFTTYTGGVSTYPFLIMQYDSGGNEWFVQALLPSGAAALWSINPASGFNCLTNNSFPLIAVSIGSGWPNPLVVSVT